MDTSHLPQVYLRCKDCVSIKFGGRYCPGSGPASLSRLSWMSNPGPGSLPSRGCSVWKVFSSPPHDQPGHTVRKVLTSFERRWCFNQILNLFSLPLFAAQNRTGTVAGDPSLCKNICFLAYENNKYQTSTLTKKYCFNLNSWAIIPVPVPVFLKKDQFS